MASSLRPPRTETGGSARTSNGASAGHATCHPAPHRAVERLGELEALDTAVQPLRSAAVGALGEGSVREVLRGTSWIGHALHPLLTDVPIGCWRAAVQGAPVGR